MHTLRGLRGHRVHPGPPEVAVERGRGPWSGHLAGLGQQPPRAVHYPVPIDSWEGGGQKGACGSSSWSAQGHRNYPQKQKFVQTHPPGQRPPPPSLREQDTPQAGRRQGRRALRPTAAAAGSAERQDVAGVDGPSFLGSCTPGRKVAPWRVPLIPQGGQPATSNGSHEQ